MNSWDVTKALLYRDAIWAGVGVVLFVVAFFVFTWLHKRDDQKRGGKP